MKTRNVWCWGLLAVMVSVLLSPHAMAQTIPAISRSPGNMVNAGIARAQNAVRSPFQRPQITETASQTPGPQLLFFAEAVNILLNEFNRLLFFFGNRLSERAGLGPLLLLPTLDSGSGGSQDSGGGTKAVGESTPTDPSDGRNGGRNPRR